jgi:hypothetical protein
MIGAGVVGAVAMGALLFVPGVRDPERGNAAPIVVPAVPADRQGAPPA